MQDQVREVVSIPIDAVWNPLNALWSKLVGFVPNLLGVAVILIVGYLVSAGLKRIATAILRRVGIDEASRRVGLRATLDRAGIAASASEIVGSLVFWLLMLTFLVSAAETLGLNNVSNTIDALVRYLPSVIGAALIVVVGMVIAHFVRDVVRSGSEGLGVDYARGLSNLAYGFLLIVVASLAVGQLKIETTLLNRVVEITLFATAAALALALGLGTRDIAKHLIAGTYARDLFPPGSDLSVGENSGTVQEVGPLFTRLDTGKGRSIYIPNGQLTELVVQKKAG